MIIACASVKIWENDDLPNQICNACFLQLQNTINFKQLCEISDKAFRQIIRKNKCDDLSSNQNYLKNVKDEQFDDYADDHSLIDIKEEDKAENVINEDTTDLNGLEIPTKFEEENDIFEDIKDKHDVETFNCEKCSKEFKKAWVLGVHMHQKHKAKALKCNKCEVKCYHPLHLKEHQELAHNPSNLTCTKCKKVCSNIYKFKYHKCRQRSYNLSQCLRCNKSFKDKRELKCHNKEVHKLEEMNVACHICGKSVVKHYLKGHLSTHEERDKLTCDMCSKTFMNHTTLTNHIKSVHNQTRERNHLCNICGYALLSAADLQKHLSIHSNERPYSCDRCNKTFRREDHLRDHIKTVHLNQRKFQCKYCPQAFSRKKTLVHHERRHTGEKPHKCEVCDKRFIQITALKIHSKTHTNSKENPTFRNIDGICNGESYSGVAVTSLKDGARFHFGTPFSNI
ncbi:zinc finger protein OZF-like [Chrysoperla carnea]|uniref:zinc finger protein OZF-like n=1 Tax=Chrysoperla carnea TaxID=189513 RepID=UPI001D07B0D1|nr:zinc finger protein OZF-like [Chrysoperla carnea]